MATNTMNIFCDGLCETNPNGYGISAFIGYWGETDGRLTCEQIHGQPTAKAGACIALPGENCTNNIAEFRAIRGALIWLENHKDLLTANDQIVIHSDSQLCVNQLNQTWNCNNDGLRVLRDSCLVLRSQIPNKIKFVWIRRELNNIADDLTRKTFELAKQGGKGVYLVDAEALNA